MFKKKLKNNNKAKFRKRSSTDKVVDEDGTEDIGVLSENISKLHKKRKLGTEKGTNVTELQRRRRLVEQEGTEHEATTINDNLEEKSMTTAPKVLTGLSQEVTMEAKHQKAKEEYVKEKLQALLTGETKNSSVKEVVATTQETVMTEDELYEQLAAASKMSRDEDVGGGGPIVVGGTGLTEVVLPIEERLKAAHETQQARYQPSTKVILPKNRQNSVASAGAPRFRTSQQQFHISSDNHHPKSSSSSSSATKTLPDGGGGGGAESMVDMERPGFYNARRSSQDKNNTGSNSINSGKSTTTTSRGNDPSSRNQNRSSDDYVYKNFVTRHWEQQGRGGR